MQVQGRRYNKTVENLRPKILPETKQSLVSENTFSTNSYKHQFKYSFSQTYIRPFYKEKMVELKILISTS